MKMFFVNTDAGHKYQSPNIQEIEYDHFYEDDSSTIIGYDGDISPKDLNRCEKNKIRYSYFWKNTIYETYEEAKEYLIQNLKTHLNEIKLEFDRLKIEIINIETTLKNYES